MSKLTVKLTRPQIDALLNAATSMLAGQEGEGDFLCKADVLDRAADALAAAASVKRRPTSHCTRPPTSRLIKHSAPAGT